VKLRKGKKKRFILKKEPKGKRTMNRGINAYRQVEGEFFVTTGFGKEKGGGLCARKQSEKKKNSCLNSERKVDRLRVKREGGKHRRVLDQPKKKRRFSPSSFPKREETNLGKGGRGKSTRPGSAKGKSIIIIFGEKGKKTYGLSGVRIPKKGKDEGGDVLGSARDEKREKRSLMN